MPRLEVDGENLHYLRKGQGPTLAFLHGLGANSRLWARQIDHWASRFTCVAIDARGHGGSTARGALTMESHAADTLAALDRLGLLPAHFLGLSMGALQAAHIHALEPRAVRSLIYASCYAAAGPAEAARIAAIEEGLAASTMAEFGRRYAAAALRPATSDADRAALAGWIALVRKQDYLATARSIFTADVRPLLAQVQQPVLVVAGAADDRTPPARCAEAAAAAPRASLVQVEAAGHLANIDNPAGFAEAVDSFLKQSDL